MKMASVGQTEAEELQRDGTSTAHRLSQVYTTDRPHRRLAVRSPRCPGPPVVETSMSCADRDTYSMNALTLTPGIAPTELLERRQWVTWRMEPADGKPTKIPYAPATGHKASTTDPSTWDTYERAVRAAASRGHAGIGFVFSAEDPYVGIDLD